jgi:hypothetical protein
MDKQPESPEIPRDTLEEQAEQEELMSRYEHGQEIG